MTNSLTPIEAQRVVAVLEEANEKLQFLDTITPDVLAHRDELAQMVGDEISRIIYEQRTLEIRYEELVAQRGVLKGFANKTKYKAVQQEILAVSHALRESTKNLCRNLKDNPNIGENLLKIQKERERLQELIRKTIDELSHGTFSTLVTQVQEEKSAQERLAEILRKEKDASASLAQLRVDLENEKEEHERELQEKQATIRALKDELQQIRQATSVEGRCAKMEAEAATDSKLRQYMQERRVLTERWEALQDKKTKEESVHTASVSFLQQQLEHMKQEIDVWNSRFEDDNANLDDELKTLKADRERDLDLLNRLQERFDREVATAAAREEETRRKLELERLQAEEASRKRVAATILQRGLAIAYIKRAEQEASSKKGKGKGAKGKGKKKK